MVNTKFNVMFLKGFFKAHKFLMGVLLLLVILSVEVYLVASGIFGIVAAVSAFLCGVACCGVALGTAK